MATIAHDYLSARGGSPSEFDYNKKEGQRLGQAFFNALSGTDQERVRGTLHDPFYKHSEEMILSTIEFLLETEDKE